MADPQITAIARCLARVVPTEGHAPEDAQGSWRHALIYAWRTGGLAQLAERLADEAPDDAELQAHCRDLAERTG